MPNAFRHRSGSHEELHVERIPGLAVPNAFRHRSGSHRICRIELCRPIPECPTPSGIEAVRTSGNSSIALRISSCPTPSGIEAVRTLL